MDTNLKLLSDESSELVDMTQYKQIIRSFMYPMKTRPEIFFVVNTLSQYLVKPRRVHLIVAKHMMRYLKGTINFGIYYDGDHDYRLCGYTYANWFGSIPDKKSTSCGCYCLGSTMISWFSRKEYNVSLSTAEAEYIAAYFASCEAIWLQKLMSGLFELDLDTTVILCDNQRCITMANNPLFHDKSST